MKRKNTDRMKEIVSDFFANSRKSTSKEYNAEIRKLQEEKKSRLEALSKLERTCTPSLVKRAFANLHKYVQSETDSYRVLNSQPSPHQDSADKLLREIGAFDYFDDYPDADMHNAIFPSGGFRLTSYAYEVHQRVYGETGGEV